MVGSTFQAALARGVVLIMALAMGGVVSSACADYVVLLDGSIVEGEILESDRNGLRIRARINDSWMTIR